MSIFSIFKKKTRKHLRSYKAAFSGLNIALNYELNFQIELIVMVLIIAAGVVFQITKLEWIILTFCIGITLSAELMNTSIEVLGELKRFHAVIKKIKDLAAAAVLAVAVMDI
ncbi:diacylglycerol kinase family protein, partial [Patescibacteria group bacterium]